MLCYVARQMKKVSKKPLPIEEPDGRMSSLRGAVAAEGLPHGQHEGEAIRLSLDQGECVKGADQAFLLDMLFNLYSKVKEQAETIDKQAKRIQGQARKIKKQTAKIEQLEKKIAQLKKNSTNSSKPSSSDITKKPRKNKASGDQKRKIGGQPGHPRHERELFPKEEIAKGFEHRAAACEVCGNADIVFLDIPPRVIQQVEIPAEAIKTEHLSYAYRCGKCGKIHYSSFPPDVVREGLFKERITALVAYMKSVLHASFSTIRKYLRDVLAVRVSRGYLRKLVAKVSAALDDPYEELLKRLPLENNLNVDETGHKENGEKFWTWVFRADLYVLFRIDKSRGSQVLLDVLGKEFDGVLGCDYFSAYRKYMKDCNVTVQFCIAHLIRDIRYLEGLPDAETRAYGKKLLAAVKAMFGIIHTREEYSEEGFLKELEAARQNIVRIATEEVPSRLDENGQELNREARNMAQRFVKHGKAYFEFITTPNVEPTNNLAEQAVRFIVIDRLVTQGTRTENGRKSCERLWTVVGTCSMQGRSAFEFILQAVQAYFRKQKAPSLLPDMAVPRIASPP